MAIDMTSCVWHSIGSKKDSSTSRHFMFCYCTKEGAVWSVDCGRHFVPIKPLLFYRPIFSGANAY